jgi:peptidoglycan/xylan/chitin deacetylase (PgdA/CDA1 family)
MKWLACLLLAACATQDPQELCSESLDFFGSDPSYPRLEDQIASAGQPLLLHGHVPGHTLKISTIEHVLLTARKYHLPVITYDQIADTHRGAIALAIDDNAIDDWYALRPLLAAYHVHVTFFVSRWYEQGPQQIDELMQLAADGNELEPHTVNHLRPVEYVAAHGLDAWLADEVDPSIQVMRDHGLEPKFFAYPFGERTDAMDEALLGRVSAVRATGSHCKR